MHYYPFGMQLPGRTYNAGSEYRYGFNGKENSAEISTGAISFEARVYDSRIGRFFSTDPREAEYAWQSTYVYFKNSPISTIDFGGMGAEDPPAIAPNNKQFILSPQAKIISTNSSSTTGNVAGTGVQAQAVEGSINSFSIGDRTFEAFYDTKSGEFTRYKDQNGTAYNPEDFMSFEEKYAAYVNFSHDGNAGFAYGFVVNGLWGTIKTLAIGGTLAQGNMSYAINPNSYIGKAQRELLIGSASLVVDAQLNYGGNITTAMAGNYIGGAYNDYASGDFFKATSRTGQIGFDVATFYTGTGEFSAATKSVSLIKTDLTVAEQAFNLSRRINNNSVFKIADLGDGMVMEYGLFGATHKGVPTPHIQMRKLNINPSTGIGYYNKVSDFVLPMNQTHINYLTDYFNLMGY